MNIKLGSFTFNNVDINVFESKFQLVNFSFPESALRVCLSTNLTTAKI